MRRFPWDGAMAFGFGILRLAPDAFWRLTPRELAAAALAHFGSRDVPDIAALRRLMEERDGTPDSR